MPKRETKDSTPRERSGTDSVCLERNWNELPQDILHLISKKLSDISDFIRFRVVCKSWQFSTSVTDPPLQLPWLLQHHQDIENGIICFYCLSSGKVHTIRCPSFHRAWLIGPGSRYLLASYLENYKICLFNPLTNDQIHVPSINVPGFCPDYIGPDPIEGSDIVVISGFRYYSDNRYNRPNMMAFWQPKDDDWVSIEGIGCNNLSANTYYMGQYFCDDRVTGTTYVIDISTGKIVYEVPPPEGANHPLLHKGSTVMVESGRKILRLFQHSKAGPCHFDIYCLYFGEEAGKPCWVKITDIGDQMLFLQYSRGLSLCASNFAGFKANCIYFLKNGRYFCRYDIGDGTTEMISCPFVPMAWFVPSLV